MEILNFPSPNVSDDSENTNFKFKVENGIFGKTFSKVVELMYQQKESKIGSVVSLPAAPATGKSHVAAEFISEFINVISSTNVINTRTHENLKQKIIFFVTDKVTNARNPYELTIKKLSDELKCKALLLTNRSLGLKTFMFGEDEKDLQPTQEYQDLKAAISTIITEKNCLPTLKKLEEHLKTKEPHLRETAFLEFLNEDKDPVTLKTAVAEIRQAANTYLKAQILSEKNKDASITSIMKSDFETEELVEMNARLREKIDWYARLERVMFPLELIIEKEVNFVAMTLHKYMYSVSSICGRSIEGMELTNSDTTIIWDEIDSLMQIMMQILLDQSKEVDHLSIAQKFHHACSQFEMTLPEDQRPISDMINGISEKIDQCSKRLSLSEGNPFDFGKQVVYDLPEEVSGTIFNSGSVTGRLVISGLIDNNSADESIYLVENDNNGYSAVLKSICDIDSEGKVVNAIEVSKLAGELTILLNNCMVLIIDCIRKLAPKNEIRQKQKRQGEDGALPFDLVNKTKQQILHRFGRFQNDEEINQFLAQFNLRSRVIKKLKDDMITGVGLERSVYNGGISSSEIYQQHIDGMACLSHNLTITPELLKAYPILNGSVNLDMSGSMDIDSCICNFNYAAIQDFCGGEEIFHEPQSKEELIDIYNAQRPDANLSELTIKVCPETYGDLHHDVSQLKYATNEFLGNKESKLALLLTSYSIKNEAYYNEPENARASHSMIIDSLDFASRMQERDIVAVGSATASTFFNRDYTTFIDNILFGEHSIQPDVIRLIKRMVDSVREIESSDTQTLSLFNSCNYKNRIFVTMQPDRMNGGIKDYQATCKWTDTTLTHQDVQDALDMLLKDRSKPVSELAELERAKEVLSLNTFNKIFGDSLKGIIRAPELTKAQNINAIGEKYRYAIINLIGGDETLLRKLCLVINGKKINRVSDLKDVDFYGGDPKLMIFANSTVAEKGINITRKFKPEEVESGKVVKIGERNDNVCDFDFLYMGNLTCILGKDLSNSKFVTPAQRIALGFIVEKMREAGEIDLSTCSHLKRIINTRGTARKLNENLVKKIKRYRSYRLAYKKLLIQILGRPFRSMHRPNQQVIIVNNKLAKAISEINLQDHHVTPEVEQVFKACNAKETQGGKQFSEENQLRMDFAARWRPQYFKGKEGIIFDRSKGQIRLNAITNYKLIQQFMMTHHAGFVNESELDATIDSFLNEHKKEHEMNPLQIANLIKQIKSLFCHFESHEICGFTNYYVMGNPDMHQGLRWSTKDEFGSFSIGFSEKTVDLINKLTLSGSPKATIQNPAATIRVSAQGWEFVVGGFGELAIKDFIKQAAPDAQVCDLHIDDFELLDFIVKYKGVTIYFDAKMVTENSANHSERFNLTNISRTLNHKLPNMLHKESNYVVYTNVIGSGGCSYSLLEPDGFGSYKSSTKLADNIPKGLAKSNKEKKSPEDLSHVVAFFKGLISEDKMGAAYDVKNSYAAINFREMLDNFVDFERNTPSYTVKEISHQMLTKFLNNWGNSKPSEASVEKMISEFYAVCREQKCKNEDEILLQKLNEIANKTSKKDVREKKHQIISIISNKIKNK
ncbi:hypothetical protein KW882_04675 [Vibrio parahaemolyticus]